VPKIHEQLSQAELLLDKHLVDAGYIDASNLVESHQFEEEIGVASSENGLFIAKMEFSVRTRAFRDRKKPGKIFALNIVFMRLRRSAQSWSPQVKESL